MRSRAAALALVAALLAPTLPAASGDAPQSGDGDHPNCGSLAPFETSCRDLRPFRMGNDFTAVVHVLGFVGTIKLTVIGLDGDDDSVYTLTCLALGANTSATLTCEGRGEIERRSWIVMLCKVTPYPVEGAPTAGPSGPYGCEVLL